MKKTGIIALTILILFSFSVIGYTGITSIKGPSIEVRGESDYDISVVAKEPVNQKPDPAEPGKYVEVRFRIENTGNVFVNVTVNATDLWPTAPNPNESYQFKVDEPGGGSGSSGLYRFNWTLSVTEFTNMPDAATLLLAIVDFNYTNPADVAEVDINITAPPEEEPGIPRNSTITFIATRA